MSLNQLNYLVVVFSILTPLTTLALLVHFIWIKNKLDKNYQTKKSCESNLRSERKSLDARMELEVEKMKRFIESKMDSKITIFKSDLQEQFRNIEKKIEELNKLIVDKLINKV